MSEKRLFKNNYINWFFTSKIVDGFFFSILCATIFTFAVCHWILDLNYKFENLNQTGPIVDLNWVFWIAVIFSVYNLAQRRRFYFDGAFGFLCLSMILIGVLDYHCERYEEVRYAWIIPMSYVIGKLVGRYFHEKKARE